MVEEGLAPAADPRAVRAAVDAVDADEVLRFARTLVAAPSENPGGTEDEAAAVAGEILASIGAAPETIRSPEGRPNVLASLGSGDRPALAWNGHLDVVPAGALERWEHPPYAAAVAGGRLIGRGAADMKGPIASALAAAAAVSRAGVSLAGTLRLHLVADEEHAGVHGTPLLFERGLLDQDACVVGEPSELRLGLAERGGAFVRAVARGRGAHGSTPQLGVNAIASIARLIPRLPEVLPDREHPLVGRPTVNPAVVAGGTARNVVPDRCELDVDRRTIPGEDSPAEVLEAFVRLGDAIAAEHPEVDLAFHLVDWVEAAETDPRTPIAAVCRSAVREETGSMPPDVGFTGITDARCYINDAEIPTVILGPGSLTVAHTANESVAVDELVAAARIYARIFVGFLGA
jgi:acetylornithine deacetylase/succinyl-diaminopimelate desuccinylase